MSQSSIVFFVAMLRRFCLIRSDCFFLTIADTCSLQPKEIALKLLLVEVSDQVVLPVEKNTTKLTAKDAVLRSLWTEATGFEGANFSVRLNPTQPGKRLKVLDF